MSNHWEKLKYYQVKSKHSVSKSFMMLVNFGVTNLRGTVMAESDQNGMFMTPIFLGYKPLPTVYIPWNEISTKKNVISEEEIQKRIETLKIKFNQYKIEKDKSNKQFNSIKEVELTNFFKEITPHIEEFMEKNSIKIILDKKNIFIANSNYDITSELINFLNNKK